MTSYPAFSHRGDALFQVESSRSWIRSYREIWKMRCVFVRRSYYEQCVRCMRNYFIIRDKNEEYFFFILENKEQLL